CGPFHRLRGEVKRLDTDRVIRGRITEVAAGKGSVYVVVFRWPTPELVEFVDVEKLAATPQEFAFLVPSGDDYLLGAVQDLDGDGQRGPDDPLWFYGDPTPVPFGPDRRSESLDVRLASPFRAPPAGLLPAFAAAPARRPPPARGRGPRAPAPRPAARPLGGARRGGPRPLAARAEQRPRRTDRGGRDRRPR